MSARRDILLLCVGLAGALLAAYLLQREISNVAGALLGDYELSLPSWLKFALTYYRAAWLLPLLVLGVWKMWPSSSSRGAAAGSLGVGLLSLACFLAYQQFFRFSVTL